MPSKIESAEETTIAPLMNIKGDDSPNRTPTGSS